jgi:hypothetical protein
MGKEKLSQILLFFAGLNAFIGAAAAKLDVIYLIAGLGTGALCYYLRYELNSEKESTLKNLLITAAGRLK